jgi:uncharacterized protein (DUF58 family)
MMEVFDEATLRKLEQLTLSAGRVRAGVMKGERRSRKRGTSVEFADYRDYARGDDLRRVDWNVFARLERPFIKLLEEEEDLALHLLIDASESMNWPAGDSELNKLHYALRLAGALAYIGLQTGDRVSVALLNSSGDLEWGPYRGRQTIMSLLHFLEGVRAAGITELNFALSNYAMRARRPGLSFIVSDLFSPAGYEEGLNALQARGHEVGILHLISPDEADPSLDGDVKLVDVETQEDAEVTLDGSILALYRRRLNDWRDEIAAHCAGRDAHYVPVVTDLPWEKLVLQTLRAKGLVK